MITVDKKPATVADVEEAHLWRLRWAANVIFLLLFLLPPIYTPSMNVMDWASPAPAEQRMVAVQRDPLHVF